MNNVKKIAVLLLALGVTTGLMGAANKEEKAEGKPDATLELSGGSVAAGIGFSWGKGTLTYKGKEYPVSVDGLSLGKVGITEVSASGKVYHLKKLQDFDGNYKAGGVGMTIAGGGSKVAMENQNGVKVLLGTTTMGVDLTIGGGGVKMRVKK